MKKLASVIICLAMIVSGISLAPQAYAQDIPELTMEQGVSITLPANGSSDNETKVAKFVAPEDGWYYFECDKEYTSTAVKEDEFPGGAIGIDEDSEGEPTQGFIFFTDLSKATEEEMEAIKEAGMGEMNKIRFTAPLIKGQAYYIDGYQDGGEDFTATITVSKHEHKVKVNTEKVTVSADGTTDDVGGIFETCEDSFCGYLEYRTIYKQIENTTVKSCNYTGKAVTPDVVIKTTDGKKLASKYYDVTFKNNVKVGEGKAIIKFKNGYKGTVTKTFKIRPKTTSINKVTQAGKGRIRITYKKVKGVTGYQVQVATDKDFTKNKRSATFKNPDKTKVLYRKLKSGKKYYVRVRTFKTVNGVKIYSRWSELKYKKVK